MLYIVINSRNDIAIKKANFIDDFVSSSIAFNGAFNMNNINFRKNMNSKDSRTAADLI